MQGKRLDEIAERFAPSLDTNRDLDKADSEQVSSASTGKHPWFRSQRFVLFLLRMRK